MRKIVLIAGALLVTAITSAVAPGAPSKMSAHSALLVGTWDTGPIPIRKLRAALAAYGYKKPEVTAFFKYFGLTNAYEFKILFYGENGVPFYLRKAWDPSKGAEPSDADHGPYTLLPNHRFVSRGVDPPTDRNREVFAYTVTKKRLTLKLIRLTEPGFSKADLALDTIFLRSATAFPFKRIR